MALTATAKKYGAEQISKNKMKFFGLFKTKEEKKELTAETAEASSVLTLTGSEAKGFKNEKMVVFRTLPAGQTGFVVKRLYFVVGAGVNSFELAEEIGGTAQKAVGSALKANAETTFDLIEEISGGGYVRIAATFAGIKDGSEDATTRSVKVPAATTVTYGGWWEVEKTSEETKPSIEKLYAVELLPEKEVFGGEGEYKLTKDVLEAELKVA